jgi:hypothetical protein
MAGGDAANEELAGLIGRAPDPVADRRALSVLSEASCREFHELIEGFYRHPEWCQARLGALFPGLALLGPPRPCDMLGMRAANALGRVGLVSWRDLASICPEALLALPEIGRVTSNEITATVARAWASAYLQETASVPNSTVTERTNDEQLLASAFEDLEQTPGFDLLRKRHLDPNPPRLATLGAEVGLSKERVRQKLVIFDRLLSKRMQEDDWPVKVAADELARRLGSVARPNELNTACVAVDPDGRALPTSLPHRRALLLRLRGYVTDGDWILETEIERLTQAVLIASTDGDSASLEVVGRRLSRIGVREEVQLPWIVEQKGFRLIDGAIVRMEEPQPSRQWSWEAYWNSPWGLRDSRKGRGGGSTRRD